MKWVLFGATGVALAKDPQSGERMLSVLIYMASFALPIAPLIVVGCKKRAYVAVRSLKWAKTTMVATVMLAIVGLVLIGLMLPMVHTTMPAFVTANVSMISGLLIMRLAEKRFWVGTKML